MPDLTIVIATYNRAARLRACLQSLCKQTQPATDFEVIVVIDGSVDGTRAMLAEMKTPFALRTIWQENSGQCVAHNRGIAAASGRYCLFVDDDIVASPTLVAEHLKLHREREGVVGIGQLTLCIARKGGWFVANYAQAWRFHYEHLNRGEVPPSWVDCYGGNMSAPRAALLAIGGFATDLPRAYDFDIAYRLVRQGLTLVYLSEAIGQQDERKGFYELTRDAEKAGAAAIELCRRQPGMLPELLGKFNEAPLRVVLLRRLFLTLRLPPRVLNLTGRLMARSPWVYAWYLFTYGYCYWRGVKQTLPTRRAWRRLIYSTPILMYHAFAGSGEPTSRYIMPARRFAWQMAWLKWRGYRVISLEEFLQSRHEHRLAPSRSVVLTVDDGYADILLHAYPILKRYRFPATIFLVSGAVGKANEWDQGSALARRPLLSWPDIRKMMESGISYGAHTRTHARLPALPHEEMEREIAGSRGDLQRVLGVPIVSFAYPYGAWSPEVRAVVAMAGFLGACGIEPGKNSPVTPLHGLRRLEIYGTDSLPRFALGLWLGKVPRGRSAR